MTTPLAHERRRYPLPFAGAQVRRFIGGFMPVHQRLKCQLLLGKGGFDLGTVQALRDDHPTHPDAMALRILQGRAEPLEGPWIPPGEQTWMVQAARDGVLELVKGLRAQDPPCHWDKDTCSAAAKGGHLEILKWARAQGSPWDVDACCPFDDESCCPFDDDTCCDWDEDTCSAAAEGGHLEIMQWLTAQGRPWDELTCCDWDEDTCSAAAEGGHLEILKWLRAQDRPCPWDEDTCEAAAKGGHLEILKWLRAQDPPCPWDSTTYDAATTGDHVDVKDWLNAEGCPQTPGLSTSPGSTWEPFQLMYQYAYPDNSERGFYDLSYSDLTSRL